MSYLFYLFCILISHYFQVCAGPSQIQDKKQVQKRKEKNKKPNPSSLDLKTWTCTSFPTQWLDAADACSNRRKSLLPTIKSLRKAQQRWKDQLNRNFLERTLQQQLAGQSCSNNRRKSLLPTIYKLVPTSTHKHVEKVEPICTNQQQWMGRVNLEAMWADGSAWTARPLFATPLLGLQEEVGKSHSEILDVK